MEYTVPSTANKATLFGITASYVIKKIATKIRCTN